MYGGGSVTPMPLEAGELSFLEPPKKLKSNTFLK
jgi:hypothetical protein